MNPTVDSQTASDHISQFLDRDLGWLEFNRRVLYEALDERTPLLERLMFLGIFTSNLDEFFMKRVGLLHRRMSQDQATKSQSKQHKLQTIRDTVLPMLGEQARCYTDVIRPQLAEHGVHLLDWSGLSPSEREEANTYFRRNVFPALTPQAVDLSHPFPFLSNLSHSLAVELTHPRTGQKHFARVKIPKLLPQWIPLQHDGKKGVQRLVALRDLVRQNLDQLFSGMIMGDVMQMRITRSVAVEDEVEPGSDLLEMVEQELRQRRLGDVVRFEHSDSPSPWLLAKVIDELRLTPDQIYAMPAELDYRDLMRVSRTDIPKLRYPPFQPVTPPTLRDDSADIFSLIRAGDVLVHHPYESFDASVARFIRAAVEDPDTLAIKMTVYRTSDDTPFVPWLIQAAESGKQAACLVELKARFDEHRNIRWANALESAGVHVVYGVMGIKTHTKTTLVVRRETDGIRTYAHVGTGNYHPQTAKLYTDLGLLTCDPQITGDVVELFHRLTGHSLKSEFRRLLVAPLNMKQRFLELIQREVDMHQQGRPARIVAKMNQIEDRDMIQALYAASQAGVPIDLLVRGFCCLRPGVPELSPTIRVISVIGRFLEHSRIFHFRNAADDPVDGEVFLGSADWMTRNLEERVEAVTPISNRAHRQRLWNILQASLQDQRQAWEMQPDGTYQQRRPDEHSSRVARQGTHQTLMEQADLLDATLSEPPS
jgi:polyphosphate kinase